MKTNHYKKRRSLMLLFELLRVYLVPSPAFNNTLQEGMLIEDKHLEPAAKILEQYAPAFSVEIFHGLINACLMLKEKEEEVIELEKEINRAREIRDHVERDTKLANVELRRTRLTFPFRMAAKIPTLTMLNSGKVTLISVGLSTMLFLALSEVFDLDLGDPSFELLWKGSFLFFTAISINLGIQESFQESVFQLMKERAESGIKLNADTRSFWRELFQSNTRAWKGILFICLEMLSVSYFASLRLPLQHRTSPLALLGVLSLSAYLATVNIDMAWSQGMKKFRLSCAQESQNGTADITSMNASLLDSLSNNHYKSVQEASRARIHLRYFKRKYKLSNRSYKKLYRKVTKYSQRWFHFLPYLIDYLCECGASQNEIIQVTSIFNGNGHMKEGSKKK